MDSATISTNSQERYPEQEAYAIGTVVTFVALVVGIFSNVIFLSMLMVCTHRQTRLRLFLMHLGMANLFVCFFTIAFELGWRLTTSWMAGDTVCRVLSLTKTLGLYAQSYVVVAMTVDHYYTVMWPKHTKSQSQRAKNLLAMAWAAASVFSIPQTVVFHEEENPDAGNLKQCGTFNAFISVNAEAVYVTFGLLAMYGFPLVIIISLNSLLLCKIRFGRTKPLPGLTSLPPNLREPDGEVEYPEMPKAATSISIEEYSEESEPSSTNLPSQVRVRIHTGFEIRHTEMIVQFHARRRAMKLAVLMMVTFTLSFSPYVSLLITLATMERSAAVETELGENMQSLTDGSSIFSLCLSTFINPLLYGVYVCYDNWHWQSLEERLPNGWDLQLNDQKRRSSHPRSLEKGLSIKEDTQ